MNKKLFWIFIVIGLTNFCQAFDDSCGPKFNGRCFCGKTSYEGREQYVVNCTNAGFDNTSVLEFIPQETQVLIFTGNYIPVLPWNVFGPENDYISLKVIDMSNNHIREIRGKSYHHVQSVTTLILNHNNLSISRYDDEENHHHPRVFSNFLNLVSLHLTNAFSDNTSSELSEDLHDIFVNSNLTKLQKLHLEQNEIVKFKDHKVFCGLPSLTDLYLGDNYIKEINFNILCLKNLRFLDLERNKFEFLRMTDLNLLDTFESESNHKNHLIVDFGLNPFVCDCRISTFHNWLKITDVTVRNKNNLMCFRNKIHPDQISTIQIGKCYSSKGKNLNAKTGETITLVFLLVTLIFILIGLVTALIYMSREKIKHFISPVIDNVAKKVHYTTIKDEDCPEVHV